MLMFTLLLEILCLRCFYRLLENPNDQLIVVVDFLRTQGTYIQTMHTPSKEWVCMNDGSCKDGNNTFICNMLTVLMVVLVLTVLMEIALT